MADSQNNSETVAGHNDNALVFSHPLSAIRYPLPPRKLAGLSQPHYRAAHRRTH